MENFLIPQYKELKSRTTFCIDSFSQYTTTAYCLLKHNDSSSESLVSFLNSIRTKTDYNNSNGLFKFLNQCMMEMTTCSSDVGQKNQYKTKLQLVKTPQTLYRTFKAELKLDIDRIEKMKTEHNNIMEELRQKQKELWKLNKNKPTTEIKEILNEKKMAYNELTKTEEEIRTELKQATENIRLKVSVTLLKTLKESLERLRCLIAVFAPQEKSVKLLEQIGQIDIADVVHEIYKSCCLSYNIVSPKEYFSTINFDQYLLEKPQTHGPKTLKINLEIIDNDANLSENVKQNNKTKTKWSLRGLFNNKYETKSLEKTKSQGTKQKKTQKEKKNICPSSVSVKSKMA